MDGAVFTFRTVPWKHENDERTCAMNDAGDCAEDHDRQISVSTASCQIRILQFEQYQTICCLQQGVVYKDVVEDSLILNT